MARPDPEQIVEDARKLRDERFAKRNTELTARRLERFNQTDIDIPPAYKKTTAQHQSDIINEEGRQIATLVYAIPSPHIPADDPEMQRATTLMEKCLIYGHQELEQANGPVWWQCTLAQVHDKLGVIYFGLKRKPYAGQPTPPPDDAPLEEKDRYDAENRRYKQDAGWRSVFDYRYVPTDTFHYTGNIYDPECVYEIKEVSERELLKVYGVYRTRDGGFTKKQDDPTTTPSGYPEHTGATEKTVLVTEYWDREWCVIVAETAEKKWMGMRERRGAYVLEEWQHNWGRTPYFPRPAFVTEQLDEDKKFASPIDGIHVEMPYHKRVRTMMDSVAYQTAFAPLKVVTKETGEQILDDSSKPLLFLELKPGEAIQLAPGQDVMPVGQSPEISILANEVIASQQRIERYTLSPIAKGISPGADTANAAISNLHRFQLSTLDPMAREEGLQGQRMYRFALEQLRRLGETTYVLNPETDAYLALPPEMIVSVNVQAKATPDQGQMRLLVQKHAMELWLARAISRTEMYEMMGYENPEEKAREVEIEDFATQLKPIVFQQVIQTLGLLDGINRMIQGNAQTGSAQSAIPQIMQEARGMQEDQPTGMGQGSGGMPRAPGTRMPVTDVNTQEGLVGV